MSAPVVFFDIAGPDLAPQSAFYSAVFGWEIDPAGSFVVSMAPSPFKALLRVDPAEKVLYLGVPDINVTLAQIEAHGGKALSPRMVVPGVVILALFSDPAGNRMGLVEMGGDTATIP